MTNMAWEETTVLTRDDFDAGPSSYDEIIPGLFLGNLTAATDVEWLKEAKISHVLTVDSCPLPRKIQELFSNPSIMYIRITDLPREDLLIHFEESYHFIDRALESDGKILIHCYVGMSRSATIVIAYLMKKREQTFSDTYNYVKSKRRFVEPNPGFVAQLQLYESMGYRIDGSDVRFKMYRLQIAGDRVRKAKILPRSCVDLVKPDPALATVRPEPTVYRCKKCRRILAGASNILPHLPREKLVWRHISSKCNQNSDQKKNDRVPVEKMIKDDNAPTEFCNKIYFVEPLAWMTDIPHNVEGKLHCPECNTKLGAFSWIASIQCPCGSKIAPAFYLVPSKVDWSNVVQNVQVTV